MCFGIAQKQQPNENTAKMLNAINEYLILDSLCLHCAFVLFFSFLAVYWPMPNRAKYSKLLSKSKLFSWYKRGALLFSIELLLQPQ